MPAAIMIHLGYCLQGEFNGMYGDNKNQGWIDGRLQLIFLSYLRVRPNFWQSAVVNSVIG